MKFPVSEIRGATLEIEVNSGEVLFVTGKNGCGKSTLVLNWARSRPEHPVLTGNREVSFSSSAVSLSPEQMQEHLKHGKNHMQDTNARTNRAYHNNQNWLNGLITRLDSFGNQCARSEVAAHRAGDQLQASKCQELDPVSQINQVFHAIGLDLILSVDDRSNYLVTKRTVGTIYGINQMSDGERAALILISSVILAEQGQVITLDEPERHMHRSISSPLLRELFRRRQDLIWIVATHDVALLRDFADSRLLVLYAYDGLEWKFDYLSSTRNIPEEVVDAIYGAREKVLFIEGKEGHSIDEPLYQALFSGTTVRSRGTCNEVRRSVDAINSIGSLNSMTARGLVDADSRADLKELSKSGVAVLEVYAVESLYFHPEVVAAVADKLGKALDVDALLSDACDLISETDLQIGAERFSESEFRSYFQSIVPRLATLRKDKGMLEIDLSKFDRTFSSRLAELVSAKQAGSWINLIRLVKIRSTKAPKFIVDKLGLTPNGYYEQARRAIASSENLRATIFGLVPNPFI